MSDGVDLYERGLEVKKALGINTVKPALGADEEFVEHTTAALYGNVYGRPGLSLRDRELITMAVMIANNATFDNLFQHFKKAPTLGITDREIREMIFQTMYYSGWPKGATAIKYYNRVLAGEERVTTEELRPKDDA